MAIDHRPRDVTAILLRCSISGREPYPAPLPHARRPKLGRGHVYWGGWPMLTALLQAVFDVSSCAFLFRQAPRLLDARRRFPVLIALDAPPRVRVSVPQMTAVVGSRRNNVLGPRRVCARPLDGRAALRRTAPVRSLVAWRHVGTAFTLWLRDHARRMNCAGPSSRIRLSALTAIATSALRRSSARDLRASPMTRL